MPAKSITAEAALLALAVSSLFATAPVPRKAPELKFLDPSGKEILLSSFGGKVVIIEFMLVKCPHCLHVAQMINKLNGELGRRDFQPVGIVLDDGINGSTVKKFIDYFKVDYTVGYTTSDNVDSYLGREEKERFMVPQIVGIDRKGVIRAQSRPVREGNLEDEIYLRNFLNTLRIARAPAGSATNTASPRKQTNQTLLACTVLIHSSLETLEIPVTPLGVPDCDTKLHLPASTVSAAEPRNASHSFCANYHCLPNGNRLSSPEICTPKRTVLSLHLPFLPAR